MNTKNLVEPAVEEDNLAVRERKSRRLEWKDG